jgi:NitT/TauT family transport system ATP-binding protein
MSALSIKNVWIEYGSQVVLERVNLEINAGAFIAIVGPSGCGKTSFLRLLLGQERPARGSILLDGKPMPSEPGPDRGVVFQRYSVMPHLTVLGNVLLGPELEASPLLGRTFGKKRRALVERAQALLSEVGLGDSLQKYPTQLSGGMQQRLALVQALIRQPRVLLLDEPFGALDPGIRGEIHVLMKKLWKETGVTIVMVTHDLREAFLLGTRVVVFDRLRNKPEEKQRYGATVSQNIEVHRRHIPGQDFGERIAQDSDRDDPVAVETSGRDDPATTH